MLLVNLLVCETPDHYGEQQIIRCKVKNLYTKLDGKNLSLMQGNLPNNLRPKYQY